MKLLSDVAQRLCRRFSGLALACGLAVGATALASPGAHGPNGEHLDAPAATGGGSPAASSPRFQAQSEAFELVGRLQGGELSMFINRYETNEPVLDAQVEVESGGRKARAEFHRDMGDYAVDDAAFLELLATQGRHALLITILAGADSDLLDATLDVAPRGDAGDHQPADRSSTMAFLLAGSLVAAAAIGSLAARRRRTARREPLRTGAPL